MDTDLENHLFKTNFTHKKAQFVKGGNILDIVFPEIKVVFPNRYVFFHKNYTKLFEWYCLNAKIKKKLKNIVLKYFFWFIFAIENIKKLWKTGFSIKRQQ